jgi:hypothetical protein
VEPDNRPFVVVGFPHGTDQVHAVFAWSLANMVAMSAPHALIALTHSSSSIVTVARDSLIESAYVIQERFAPRKVSHVMMLDTDMEFPHDTLIRLLAHNKDIVGATYMRKVAPFDLHCTPIRPNAEGRYEGLVEAQSMALGVSLIRFEVFDRIRPPWFRIEYDRDTPDPKYRLTGEDYVFCEEVRSLGYRLWVDLELSKDVVHWGGYGFRQADFEAARRAGQKNFVSELKKVLRA